MCVYYTLRKIYVLRYTCGLPLQLKFKRNSLHNALSHKKNPNLACTHFLIYTVFFKYIKKRTECRIKSIFHCTHVLASRALFVNELFIIVQNEIVILHTSTHTHTHDYVQFVYSLACSI